MIERAVDAVRNGEVVGLPTDTVYGVGVDPFNESAVSKLFDLKGRPSNRPVGILVATVDQAREIGVVGGAAADLAANHWPGALTLIVTPKVVMADWVGDRQRRSIGIRVPDHEVALELLAGAGPLAVTSANESGGREAMNHREARAVFGDRVEVYLEGKAPGGQASTVVDATGSRLTVVRPGPVPVD